MVALTLNEDVIGLNVAMNDFILGYEIESSSQLESYLQGLPLGYGSALLDDVLEIAVRAKLEDHCYIVLRQKAVVYLRCKKDVDICVSG